MQEMNQSHQRVRDLILAELAAAGDDGRTDYELAEATSANKNHVPTRRRDLELNDLCAKTSKTRPTDTGFSAIVHRITDKGREWFHAGKPAPARPASPAAIVFRHGDEIEAHGQRTRAAVSSGALRFDSPDGPVVVRPLSRNAAKA